ncbi:hypothetical protein AB0O20_03060 [Streptomyces kronopolitis]|uniref:hypothetical protein n=1 Tax=Streptomyces kronopolitis TaxID=1612435 RepID=UPI00343C2269
MRNGLRFMPIGARAGRLAAVGALGASLVASGVLLAPGAQAADTGHGKISCSAVKVRKSPAKNATAVGVAYKGDKIAYDQFAYKRAEKTWYTRGTVTRKSDGKKVRGYVFYKCANPYGTNPAPTPPIPKK